MCTCLPQSALHDRRQCLRLIPNKAPLPVDPSIDKAHAEEKSMGLHEYLYKLKNYRPARENKNSRTVLNGNH